MLDILLFPFKLVFKLILLPFKLVFAIFAGIWAVLAIVVGFAVLLPIIIVLGIIPVGLTVMLFSVIVATLRGLPVI
ncbi:MAG: hypothetical protein PHD88_03635 [Firmicutes bacterium]|nr:hypothetical protein [Bacillota bacterium]MDD4262870.1 hypothetical protein [Bacillota bacterium]MDD4693482.1 hypothetical protein [Bacillota bacterium]